VLYLNSLIAKGVLPLKEGEGREGLSLAQSSELIRLIYDHLRNKWMCAESFFIYSEKLKEGAGFICEISYLCGKANSKKKATQ